MWKNATVAQSVTNYSLDPSILIMKRIYQSFMGKFATQSLKDFPKWVYLGGSLAQVCYYTVEWDFGHA